MEEYTEPLLNTEKKEKCNLYKQQNRVAHLWYSFTCYKEHGHHMIYKNLQGKIVKGNYITYTRNIDGAMFDDLVWIDKIDLNYFIGIDHRE